jgi:hypothetical protein
VTGHERKIDDAIVVIQALDVSVADPAVGDGNPHLLVPGFGWFVSVRLERLSHRFGGISFYCRQRHEPTLLF